MNLNNCIERLDKYLESQDAQPRFVNLNNVKDLSTIKEYFSVGNNRFLKISDYCRKDGFPRIDNLLQDLTNIESNIFLTGITTYLKLMGADELRHELSVLLHLLPKGKLVILGFQCNDFINISDVRLQRLIYEVEGPYDVRPQITFISADLSENIVAPLVTGVENIPEAIESGMKTPIFVQTEKEQRSFPNSLFIINEEKNAYQILSKQDPLTKILPSNFGSENQWRETLREMRLFKNWNEYINSVFGSTNNLEFALNSWGIFDDQKKWLYIVALKLFGSKNNWCVNEAINNTENSDQFVRSLFRSILSLDHKDQDYWGKYEERKLILKSFETIDNEIVDFCSYVQSKGKDALYYLTDNNQLERETIIELLDRFSDSYSSSELNDLLAHIYPDLYYYLQPFEFNNELLDQYFQEYKYQKLLNRIDSGFKDLVEEQAVKRDYNRLLPTRSEKIEAIDKTKSQLYFIDAMGVEFLGYLMEKCRAKGLYAKVTVCRCSLPSITSCNKEFIEEFEDAGLKVVSIKKIDDIKHKGEDRYNYEQTKLPIHLVKELEILDDILNSINVKLVKGDIKKAVMVSDHGASRLAVISEENKSIDIEEKGSHGGRVCESEKNYILPQVTKEDNVYVMANYDRFKGSRAPSVEVHGGATLEEVTIPIIEITRRPTVYEIKILNPVIKVSYKKTAELQFFSKESLNDVTVKINGKVYKAELEDLNVYKVLMPEIKKAGEYCLEIYDNNNLISDNMSFTITKAGMREKDLF